MGNKLIKRRRDLLPWWMKVFIWIWMFLGASSIVSRLLGILGISLWLNSNGEKSIYGMETTENYSVLALLITMLIIFKGITAFGMWTEKDWAIKLGIIDATIGIAVCISMMFIEPIFENNEGSWNINFRFELVLLIPYLIKCLQIRKQWDNVSELSLSDTLTTTISETINEQRSESAIDKMDDRIVIEDEKAEDEKIDKEDHSRFMPK